ncbi:MAG: hypothetical protein ACI9LM_001647 [Alteromonadaceae bacterium]|jgi:hypothetical protein
MKIITNSMILVLFLFGGCATPPEVKQLSQSQLEYFESAIIAVTIQSEALIKATEIIVNNGKNKLLKAEADMKKDVQQALVDELKDNNEIPQINKVALEVYGYVDKYSVDKNKKLKMLANNLELVKSKSNELTEYLKQMRDVQKTLDAYIQSEKAGEKILKDTLKHPSISALLDKASMYKEKIIERGAQINKIFETIEAEQ